MESPSAMARQGIDTFGRTSCTVSDSQWQCAT